MDKVLIRNVSGTSFNLLMPDQTYRTFEHGVLATDGRDPMLRHLLRWAEQRMDITVVADGETRQKGMLVCGECGRLIDDREDREKAEAEHAQTFHATKDEQESKPARRTRGPRKG